jgi:hypothetical protein
MKEGSFNMMILITKAKPVSQEPSADKQLNCSASEALNAESQDISFFWTCSKGRIK